MTTIPTAWNRVEGELLASLREEFPLLSVSNQKPDTTAPYECVLIRADLQQKVTPVSRYCRIGVTVWNIRASGESNFQAAQETAAAIGSFIEQLAQEGGTSIIVADVDSGPIRVEDDVDHVEIAYLTLLAHVAAS